MLQEPRWVKRMAKRGMSVPTYAYAYNNPLRYTDRTGLFGEGVAEFPWWAATPTVPFLPELGAAGVVGVGAVGIGLTLGTGMSQWEDPPAGIPYPPSGPVPPGPHPPGEPGIPICAAAGAAAAGAAAASAIKHGPPMQCRLIGKGISIAGPSCLYLCPDGSTPSIDDEGVGCINPTIMVYPR
jgi:hypothetical protein